MPRCAFLTLEDSTGYVIDDELAYAPLAALGWQVDTIPWRRTNIEWHAYDSVVIRSTWDYVIDPEAFLDVLGEIERSGTLLFNGLDLVRWNIRKTYLRDLAERGVSVVPTIWRDCLQPNELPDLIEEVGTAEVVIKPVVGANARGAFRLDAQNARSRADEIYAYYADRALLAQPFLSAITTEGEFSLFYFNGALSHTILKLPKPADFRVQEEHGGIIRAVKADDTLRKTGDAALRAIGTAPLYARADFVRANDHSSLSDWRGEELSTLNQQHSTSNPQLLRLLVDGVGTHRAVALPAHGQRRTRALRARAARTRIITRLNVKIRCGRNLIFEMLENSDLILFAFVLSRQLSS